MRRPKKQRVRHAEICTEREETHQSKIVFAVHRCVCVCVCVCVSLCVCVRGEWKCVTEENQTESV